MDSESEESTQWLLSDCDQLSTMSQTEVELHELPDFDAEGSENPEFPQVDDVLAK
jgi:hypothetical protein